MFLAVLSDSPIKRNKNVRYCMLDRNRSVLRSVKFRSTEKLFQTAIDTSHDNLLKTYDIFHFDNKCIKKGTYENSIYSHFDDPLGMLLGLFERCDFRNYTKVNKHFLNAKNPDGTDLLNFFRMDL